MEGLYAIFKQRTLRAFQMSPQVMALSLPHLPFASDFFLSPSEDPDPIFAY